MAVVQLGAFVTSIAGSVGGTTFKRNKNNISVSNKSRGHQPSLIKNQVGLGAMQRTFEQWGTLSAEVQNQWSTVASNYSYSNRFGDNVPYTGRQLFVSRSILANYFGSPIPEPLNLDAVVPRIEIDFLQAESSNSFNIGLVAFAEGTRFYIQAQPIKNLKESKPLKRYKKIFRTAISAPFEFDIIDQMLAEFGTITSGSSFQVWVTPVSATFQRGVTVTEKVLVE